MNLLSLLGFSMLAMASVQAQNTVTIQQQGKGHTMSVIQRGSGNTAVINQSSTDSSNQAVISQSGAGNGLTIIQSSGSTISISQMDSTGQIIRDTRLNKANTTLNLIESTRADLIQPVSPSTKRQKKLSEKKSKSNP